MGPPECACADHWWAASACPCHWWGASVCPGGGAPALTACVAVTQHLSGMLHVVLQVLPGSRQGHTFQLIALNGPPIGTEMSV